MRNNLIKIFLFFLSVNVLAFASSESSPKFIFLTTHKGGTHLLQKALVLITKLDTENYNDALNSNRKKSRNRFPIRGDKDFSLLLHLDDKRTNLYLEQGSSVALLIRDPRDILIGQLFFLERYPHRENHPWIQDKNIYDFVNSLPFADRITWTISHPEYYKRAFHAPIEKSI